MYSVDNFSLDMTVLVSLFSVAWFIVGVLLGQRTKGGSTGGGAIELYVGNLSYDVKEKDLRRESVRQRLELKKTKTAGDG